MWATKSRRHTLRSAKTDMALQCTHTPIECDDINTAIRESPSHGVEYIFMEA